MTYYNKYLKYKSKYLKLKQHGGGLNEKQQSMFNQIYNNIFIDIELDDKNFITYDKLVQGGENDSIIDKLISILNILFMRYITRSGVKLFKDSKDPAVYYEKIEKLIKHCIEIKLQFQKLLDKIGYDKILIVLPGDSPTYFMYIIQILFPDFYDKIIKVFISISKLRNDSITEAYIKPIIDKQFSENPKLENIIIFDYGQTGCSSFKYLYDLLKYKTENIGFLDLSYFFFYNDIDFDDDGNQIDIILPVKRTEIICNDKIFNEPYTNLFIYPYKINKNPSKYPKHFPEELYNNQTILEFFVDDKDGLFGEYFRCQFSNKLNECGLIINKNNVKLCDLFRLFMYFYINKKELLYKKTMIFLKSV